MLSGKLDTVDYILTATLSQENPISCLLSQDHTLTGSISIDILSPYIGPTIITPTSEKQTLKTRNETLFEDIIINPIPSNYGLISWNGSVLTVS